MLIRVNPSMDLETRQAVIWVEYPIVTPYNCKAIRLRAQTFFVSGVDGFVEFDVDVNRWPMLQDPHIPYDTTSKIIILLPPYNSVGFPLSEPGTNPIFYDEDGDPL